MDSPTDATSVRLVYGDLPPDLTAREIVLKQQLAALHRRYQLEAEPVVKALSDLECLRPFRGVLLLGEAVSRD